MSFRQNVRIKMLALAEAPNFLHVAPDVETSLDRVIMAIAAEEVHGIQFNAFALRYFAGAAGSPRDAMRRAMQASMFGDSGPNVIRNSNRGLKRLIDRIQNSQRHRTRILQSWGDENAN